MTAKERALERKRKKELNIAIEKAQYDRDWKAMSFCLKHNFTVYPVRQLKTSFLKLFMQKDKVFKEISPELYDQELPESMRKMIYMIDKKYKETYKKLKGSV